MKVNLSLEQQRAILNFDERCDTFSEARAQELADILADCFPEADYSPKDKISILASQLAGNK